MSKQPEWLQSLSQEVWETYRSYRNGKVNLNHLSLQNAIQVVHAMTQQPNIQVELEERPHLFLDKEGQAVIVWKDLRNEEYFEILCSGQKMDRYWWKQWSPYSNISFFYPGTYDEIVVYYLCYVLDRSTEC